MTLDQIKLVIGKVKHAFGLFNLIPFEKDIVRALRSKLCCQRRQILDSQFSRFNQVERHLNDGETLKGETIFYWSRFGKGRFDFPQKFPTRKEEDLLAKMEVYSMEDDNHIEISFILVKGILLFIEYWPSKKFVHVPVGKYKIEKITVYDLQD